MDEVEPINEHPEDDSMSSSDDDQEDDFDLNDKELKEIENLKETLAKNPYDYQSYVSLIDLLRRAGELEQLRTIRNNFAKNYPLSSELWLAWISDEKRVATSNDEKQHVEDLFLSLIHI